MNKEEALEEFLKGLKAALNNGSVYFQEHPIFIKSSQELKEKIDALLNFVNPLKVGFAADFLVVDGRNLENTGLIEWLAGFFHFRKIRSIEIKEGVAIDELMHFLAKFAQPPMQIFKEGGIENYLKKEPASRILLEVLDYSQLLYGEGEGYKDIWAFLFREVIEEKDAGKIAQLADNFGKIIAKFRSDDLLENEELRKNLGIFLNYLKNTDKDKFHKCAKDVVKLILQHGNIPQEDELAKLKFFFNGLGSVQLADTLWEEITENESFNPLSLNLFSVLIDNDRHKEIAFALASKSELTDAVIDPAMKKRIKELFSSPELQSATKVYQHILLSLLKDGRAQEAAQAALDYELLPVHYRRLILNLLAAENEKAVGLSLLREKILEEWDYIVKEKDIEFLKNFSSILRMKKDNPSFTNIFEPLRIRISNFIENIIFQGTAIGDFEYFTGMLSRSSFKIDDYIKKIFKENLINQYIIKLFLVFFQKDGLPIFCDELKKRSSDMEFLKNIIESLRLVEDSLSIEILKEIFSFSSRIIKIEVLQAMQKMTAHDENFLFSVLKEKDIFLRKEAFAILADNEKTAPEALRELFGIFSPLGIRNYVLEENIGLVREKDAVMLARDYLIILSKKRFFWNSSLRKKAKEAVDECVKKIFKEDLINQYTRKLFLVFFQKDGLPIFCDELKKRSSDMEFLKNIIESLRLVEDSLSIEILKEIFSFSSRIIKIEVLQAMQKMTAHDENFLFSVLKEKDIFLRKEAFAILADNEKTAPEALRELFGIFSPLGIRNYVLEENIGLVREKDAVMLARDYLIILSKKRFFWNSSLRKKAKEALEGLDVRKH